MRHALEEGLRATWDAVVAIAVLAREVMAAFLDCMIDIVTGKPMPGIDLHEARMAPEVTARHGSRLDRVA
jgi:hypothetical protein